MRKMDDLHLVDFVELTLKGKENFEKALQIVLSSGLSQNNVLIQPSDWPQFF